MEAIPGRRRRRLPPGPPRVRRGRPPASVRAVRGAGGQDALRGQDAHPRPPRGPPGLGLPRVPVRPGDPGRTGRGVLLPRAVLRTSRRGRGGGAVEASRHSRPGCREPPGAAARSVAAFLGLPFEPVMLRYHERDRVAVERPHYRNVARPPTPGLRDWRRELRRDDVATFEAIAGGVLDDLGYERGAVLGPGARLRAGARWAAVQARRAAHKARKAAGTVASGSAPDGPPRGEGRVP